MAAILELDDGGGKAFKVFEAAPQVSGTASQQLGYSGRQLARRGEREPRDFVLYSAPPTAHCHPPPPPAKPALPRSPPVLALLAQEARGVPAKKAAPDYFL